jgi:hypothetical protein
MSFLDNTNSEFLSARITKKGRRSIAEGNFVIKYFQVGDSEFDYNFSGFTGQGNIPHQKVLSPMDGDQHVKYPYLVTSGETINFGNPISQSLTETIKNPMGPAGFVSNYKEFDSEECTGTTVECLIKEINITEIDGSKILSVTGAIDYTNCEYITILFKTRLCGQDPTLTGETQSLVYKIISISTNEITLDRNMPNLTSETGYAQVICNKCSLEYPETPAEAAVCSPIPVDNLDQHDPWSLELVWTQKPAGLDSSAFQDAIDESLTGYTGTQFASLKEYLGYTSTSGQTFTNFTGGTIVNPTSYVNSFDEKIDVTPEDQRCIAVIHYSELGDIVNDPERFFKYDDYIGSSTVDEYEINGEDISDVEYFEVYIPFMFYHRNTGTTIGAKFTMDTVNYYVSSSKNNKPNTNNVKFRFLLDEQGNRVGKVFVDKKIIVFDDQELVAILDYRTNRKWTLPAPRFNTVPVDLPTFYDLDPVIQSGETAWVTYLFQNTTDTYKNGMHCNYYGKIVGASDVTDGCFTANGATNANIGFKFDVGDFKYLSTSSYFTGFTANKFFALVQVTDIGEQPSPDAWKLVELTSQISGHTVGSNIAATRMCGYQFVITGDMYNSAGFYDIERFLGDQPSNLQTTLPQFGDSQPFPGAVKLTRATDVEVLNFMVNLPSTQFLETQNPTYKTGLSKRITEIALLNQNKEPLVMAKTAKPLTRIGNQVFSIKLDF